MNEPFVVGGDAAGLGAASKLKWESPDREGIVFEKGRWVSDGHRGMPYYVKGDVDEVTDLLTLSPETIEERGIELRREHEIVEPTRPTRRCSRWISRRERTRRRAKRRASPFVPTAPARWRCRRRDSARCRAN